MTKGKMLQIEKVINTNVFIYHNYIYLYGQSQNSTQYLETVSYLFSSKVEHFSVE